MLQEMFVESEQHVRLVKMMSGTESPVNFVTADDFVRPN